jgi:preprotein translocase subunit YajC
MVVVFVFFIILPQQRRQKKEKNFINSLKRGDKIITKSGIHGKVMDVNDKDESCVIETLAGKIKMEKSSLSMELSSKFSKK